MEKVIDKIRKLLAVARDKGATEHEAATALAMAQRLMLEHDVKNVEDHVEVQAVRGEWMNVHFDDKWYRMLAAGVASLFNCRTLFNSLGDVKFVGKPENIEVCQVTLLWVVDQVEELYKEALKSFRARLGKLDKATRGDFRKTFKEACALRVWHRAAEIVAAARGNIPGHMSLVVIDQSLAAADDLIKGAKKTALTVRRSGFGTGAGQLAGDAVKLQREVR